MIALNGFAENSSRIYMLRICKNGNGWVHSQKQRNPISAVYFLLSPPIFEICTPISKIPFNQTHLSFLSTRACYSLIRTSEMVGFRYHPKLNAEYWDETRGSDHLFDSSNEDPNDREKADIDYSFIAVNERTGTLSNV